jgi:hypothetical protein
MIIKKVKIVDNYLYGKRFLDSVNEVWVIADKSRNNDTEAKKRQWVIKMCHSDDAIVKIQNNWIFTDEKIAMLFYLKWKH